MPHDEESEIATEILLSRMEEDGSGILSNGKRVFIAIKLEMLKSLVEQAEANGVNDVMITGAVSIVPDTHSN